MRPRTAMLIFNPNAGMRDWRRVIDSVAITWRAHGWQIEIQATQRPHHATELARAAAHQGHKLVLVAGGDGTINEATNGLVHTETALAPLPVGTANCLAKELRLSKSTLFNPTGLLEAATQLLMGEVHAVDVGRTNHRRYWLLWAGVGFDSYVVHDTEPRSRQFKRLGKLAYMAKTLSLLPTFSGMKAKVTVDGDRVDGEFVFINVSNTRWFAGGELLLNPLGVLDDSLFEIWLFHGHYWPEVVRSSIDIARQIHLHQPQVKTLRGRQIEIITEQPQPAHLDGEPAQSTPLVCQLVPKALLLLTPSTTAAGLFQQSGATLRQFA